MGSTIEIVECKCGGPLHTEYFYKTGENSAICFRCGYTDSRFFRRDKKGIVREDVLYQLDGSIVLGVKFNEKTGLVWQHPISADMNIEDIFLFIQFSPDFNSAPDWMKPALYMQGNRSVYAVTESGPVQLMYIGNSMRIDTENNLFILEEALLNITCKPGNGIAAFDKRNNVTCFSNEDGMTEQEWIAFWEDTISNDKDINKSSSYLTFIRPGSDELKILRGTPPIYSEYAY